MRLFMFGYPENTDWYELRVITRGRFLDPCAECRGKAVVAEIIDSNYDGDERTLVIPERFIKEVADDEDVLYLSSQKRENRWPKMCRFQDVKTKEVFRVPSKSVPDLDRDADYFAWKRSTNVFRGLDPFLSGSRPGV